MYLIFSTFSKNRYLIKTAVLASVLMSLGLTSADAASKHRHKYNTQVIREIYVLKNINPVHGSITVNPRPVVTMMASQSCDTQQNASASSSNIIIKNISSVSNPNRMDNYRKQHKFLVRTTD